MKYFILLNKHNNWYANTVYCAFKFCQHDPLNNEYYPNKITFKLMWDMDGKEQYHHLGTYLVKTNYDVEKEGSYIPCEDNTYREYTKEIEKHFIDSIPEQDILSWIQEVLNPNTNNVKRQFIRIVLGYISEVKGV